MATGQTHQITTITDLVRVVNVENVGTLSMDIAMMLVNVAKAKRALQEKNVSPLDYQFPSTIEWTDDDKMEATFSVQDGEDTEHLRIVTSVVKSPFPDDDAAGK